MKLVCGWRSWTTHVSECAQQRALLDKVVSALRQGGLCRAFNSWRANQETVTLSKTFICKAINIMMSQSLGRAMRTWIKQTIDMSVYLNVASMQFSHVVVTPQSEGGSSSGGIEYMWRSAQDWALLHACQSGHLSTVQTLVGRGAQVGVTDGLSQNALHVAAFAGHAEIVRVLLDTPGTDIEAEDANGHTALVLASLRGHHLIMRYLAEAGSE
jgi:hypothetical protein